MMYYTCNLWLIQLVNSNKSKRCAPLVYTPPHSTLCHTFTYQGPHHCTLALPKHQASEDSNLQSMDLKAAALSTTPQHHCQNCSKYGFLNTQDGEGKMAYKKKMPLMAKQPLPFKFNNKANIPSQMQCCCLYILHVFLIKLSKFHLFM